MTDKRLTYIIGEPGIGKSTLVEALTAGAPYEDLIDPFYLRRYDNGVTELGRRREEFSGTDALPMSIQPAVEQWLTAIGPGLVLGEGDRLGNATFFQRARDLGYAITIYALTGRHTAAARRAERGSAQDPTWLKGRRTKVERLMDLEPQKARTRVEVIDASLSLELQIALMGDPVALAFR